MQLPQGQNGQRAVFIKFFALFLSRQENEKIYLLRQIDAEWMYGRNKRGCEGMFPINFIEIRVPLKDEKQQKHHINGLVQSQIATSVSSSARKARVLYDFTAEVQEDLTIRVSILSVCAQNLAQKIFCRSQTRGEFSRMPSLDISVRNGYLIIHGARVRVTLELICKVLFFKQMHNILQKNI